jgi:hypothetical protein
MWPWGGNERVNNERDIHPPKTTFCDKYLNNSKSIFERIFSIGAIIWLEKRIFGRGGS